MATPTTPYSAGERVRAMYTVPAKASSLATASPPPNAMKRAPTRYDGRSRASAVEAESSMMIGASMSSDSGMTTPP